jgi:protein phosphatase
VDNGDLSPADARHHKGRRVVTNVVGGPNQGVHAEIHKLKTVPGDVVLLCSDGLTEVVPDDVISGVLADFAHPDDACRRLIDLALEKGAPDNVTAVVARYVQA